MKVVVHHPLLYIPKINRTHFQNWFHSHITTPHKVQIDYSQYDVYLAWYEKEMKRIKRINLQQIRNYCLFLKGGCCKKCGILFDGKNDCIFDYHHRDRTKKLKQVSFLITLWGSFPENEKYKKDVLNEIEKCDLLCSNCHRLHHKK